MAKAAPATPPSNDLRDNIVRLFGGDDTPPPAETSMSLLRPTGDRTSMATSADQSAALDLTGQHKLIMTFGAGRSGKTSLLRYIVERAMQGGRQVPTLATVDALRPALKLYFQDVISPGSPATAAAWLDQLLTRLMASPRTVLLDFGADASPLPILETAPTLEKALVEAGVQPVAFYLLTPREIDLTVLDGMEQAGFKPAATALVLNVGSYAATDPQTEFAQLRRNSVYRAAVERGAREIWMPRNFAGRTLEERRLSFHAGARKDNGLGLLDQSRAFHWLEAMETAFHGVETWLP